MLPVLGAYRTVTREAALQRWLTGVPDDKKASLIPPGWFDMFADATFATDPVGAKQNPPIIRAPQLGRLDDGMPHILAQIGVGSSPLSPSWGFLGEPCDPVRDHNSR